MNFKNFILNEEAKAKHALKFFQYEEHEHDKIAKKLKMNLIKAWSKIVSRYEPLNNLESDLGDREILHSIELDEKDVKVGRVGSKTFVGPSIKIGAAYSKDVKNECKKAAMREALSMLEKIADSLNAESGSGKPFIASQEDNSIGDIRLKFKTGEFTKTIFLVAVEPGYKLERVYLKDFLSK